MMVLVKANQAQLDFEKYNKLVMLESEQSVSLSERPIDLLFEGRDSYFAEFCLHQLPPYTRRILIKALELAEP